MKELVENSLDAGARHVRVDVREGGTALVAVTDDGLGMSPAELPMALQRHATSKLASAADLQRIASFGFRGEALPAIASVSRFRIVSRARGAEHGYEIRVDAGRIVSEHEAAATEGTRIEVADLFASVPARRKFLKRAGTEWGPIADWLTRPNPALGALTPMQWFDTGNDVNTALDVAQAGVETAADRVRRPERVGVAAS